jgi:hypothetical protein
MLYDYEFTVWLNESPRWNKAAYYLFGYMRGRIVVEMEQGEFEGFRESLSQVGIDLREITRTRHNTPEQVR